MKCIAFYKFSVTEIVVAYKDLREFIEELEKRGLLIITKHLIQPLLKTYKKLYNS